jgi:hypothetical protein
MPSATVVPLNFPTIQVIGDRLARRVALPNVALDMIAMITMTVRTTGPLAKADHYVAVTRADHH